MGELAELRQGACFGPLCLLLLVGLIDDEARRLPDLRPASGIWTLDDVHDLAQEYLSAELDSATRYLLATADSDDSVGRLLRRMVSNWLRSRARTTGVGPIRERIKKLLRQHTAVFEQVPAGEPGAGSWRPQGSAWGPSTVSAAVLVAAARAVPNVTIPAWTSDTRAAPFATAPDILRILNAVFEAATGSLTVAALVDVFADRFPRALTYADPPFDPTEQAYADPASPDPVDAVVDLDERRRARHLARGMYDRLSRDERALLPVLLAPIEEQQRVTRVGRSSTYQRVAALKDRLAAWLGPQEELRATVLGDLIDMCSSTDGVRLLDEPDDVSSGSSDGDALATTRDRR